MATGSARAEASVATTSPERYAKQLAAHLGRRCEIVEEGDATRIITGSGECLVRSTPGILELHATAATPEDLEQVMHVVGSHLERFGQRNELTVTWRKG
jgi:uncharacterized protein